jgi:hypothetical protein
LHDFDQYDQEKLLSEIEVLNKEIERFGTKNFGTVPNLAISTLMTRATTPRHDTFSLSKPMHIFFSFGSLGFA